MHKYLKYSEILKCFVIVLSSLKQNVIEISGSIQQAYFEFYVILILLMYSFFFQW